jgi:hypothetical protein
VRDRRLSALRVRVSVRGPPRGAAARGGQQPDGQPRAALPGVPPVGSERSLSVAARGSVRTDESTYRSGSALRSASSRAISASRSTRRSRRCRSLRLWRPRIETATIRTTRTTATATTATTIPVLTFALPPGEVPQDKPRKWRGTRPPHSSWPVSWTGAGRYPAKAPRKNGEGAHVGWKPVTAKAGGRALLLDGVPGGRAPRGWALAGALGSAYAVTSSGLAPSGVRSVMLRDTRALCDLLHDARDAPDALVEHLRAVGDGGALDQERRLDSRALARG